MLDAIRAEARYASEYTGDAGIGQPVLDALAAVPRHAFVPEHLRDEAYANRPLPIGYGQTISQPYIVALMTDLLAIEPDDRVLEIGTGCGYQTAVLATLAQQVFSIELIEALGQSAAERLHRLGYRNVTAKVGDGYRGWPEKAPFDGIIVTAAAPHIPDPLIEQLKPGARLVIPVGQAGFQSLQVVTLDDQERIQTREILPVAFVPMRH